MKIKRINAHLSDVYIVKNFSGVIKQMKQSNEWLRGGLVIANCEQRIKNSVLANKLFPDFFPEVIPLSNNTYLRNFIDSATLEENPKKLESVIEKLFILNEAGIKKLKKKKRIKINPCGELWKIGYDLFGKLLGTKKCSAVLTYNMGDAKASNLLSDSDYLTFDSEGFGIGDISTDIISLIEGYQYNGKKQLFAKTLDIAEKKYFKIDNDIIEKSLLGLIGIRAMEIGAENRSKRLLGEAIEFFKKFKKI